MGLNDLLTSGDKKGASSPKAEKKVVVPTTLKNVRLTDEAIEIIDILASLDKDRPRNKRNFKNYVEDLLHKLAKENEHVMKL